MNDQHAVRRSDRERDRERDSAIVVLSWIVLFLVAFLGWTIWHALSGKSLEANLVAQIVFDLLTLSAFPLLLLYLNRDAGN